MQLNPKKFNKLAYSEIKPTGWLLNQLKIQANGLSGNLDKFWPDIKDSKWIGGKCDGWERVPYWLDGYIPLAWLIDDEKMKQRATFYIDEIIARQSEDGWISPDDGNRGHYDVWAIFLILKVLVVYYEATNDDRIENVIYKALKALDHHIDSTTLFGWGQMRWFESLVSIYWLYERCNETWLLKLAKKLNSQGFDWLNFFNEFWPYEGIGVKGRWGHMEHVVNNAMMLKSGALLWRMTGDPFHLYSIHNMLAKLDKHHGMVTGVFSGDECLSGTLPIRGTELCAVVEYLYSLEHLIEITGDLSFADRMEKIAFNALPATFSPDMWTHQYDQQVNQMQCIIEKDPVYNTNGPDSNIFGLEPNFGCCTANLSQGWPKFAQSAFMKTSDGIVAVSYIPCEVNTKINNVDVKLTNVTDYPFKDNIILNIETVETVDFSLYLRIPEWVDYTIVDINGIIEKPKKGTYLKLAGQWHGITSINIRFYNSLKLEKRPNDLYAVLKGPLVFSLPIGEKWEKVNEDQPNRKFPHCDYIVTPTSSWAYGLCLANNLTFRNNELVYGNIGESVDIIEKDVGDFPFSPNGAPIEILLEGKKIAWDIVNGACAPTPDLTKISKKYERIKLIPYGCTTLRMTELPILK